MPERKPGYCRIGSLLGVPILVDWTIPLQLMFAGLFAGFEIRYMPAVLVWTVILIIWLLTIYAITAKCCRLEIYQINISMISPDCQIESTHNFWKMLALISSRIVGLTILFVVEIVYVLCFDTPATGFEADFVVIVALVNFVWLLFCVMPMQSSDGQATDGLQIYWMIKYYSNVNSRMNGKYNLVPHDQSPVFSPGTSLLTKPELIPEGFEVGVEILNDSKTPMVFVIDVLVEFFDLNQTDAFAWMATIHNNGGILAKLPSLEKATEIANAIMAEAKLRGYPLVCQVVDARQNSNENSLTTESSF